MSNNLQQGAVSIKNIVILLVVMAIGGSLPGLLGRSAKKEANLYTTEMQESMESVANALNADARSVAALSARAYARSEAAQKNIGQHKNIKFPNFVSWCLKE